MQSKRVLSVQDLSCVGQCSMSVALPILAACGVEAAALPTAMLSTHTAIAGAKRVDLYEHERDFLLHWRDAGIRFNAICTGYLGAPEAVQPLLELADDLRYPGAPFLVDPAMADHGKLYAGLDEEYVEAVKTLCKRADILLPNVTEACLLTGIPYRPHAEKSFLMALTDKLLSEYGGTLILTGVHPGETLEGVLVRGEEHEFSYFHKCFPGAHPGTGDIFTAVFVGALMRAKTVEEATSLAADFAAQCAEASMDSTEPEYGTPFHQVLPKLVKKFSKC